MKENEAMKTYYAPPERADGETLRKQVEAVSGNAIMSELLHSVNGVLAVLNEHRQILAVNDLLMEMLGVSDFQDVLGLRPGEAVRCVYAHEMPAGCGTSEFCPTCGAVISIVTSLATNRPQEGTCALTTEKDGVRQDLYFRVRCAPVTYTGQRLLLLFLQDITYQNRVAALEKVFFHDVNNVIAGLVGSCQLISLETADSNDELCELSEAVFRLSKRLAGEVAIQRSLMGNDGGAYLPTRDTIPLNLIFQELHDTFSANPVSDRKLLTLPAGHPDRTIRTDAPLFMRVLGNMVTNAFEATEEGGEVKVWVEMPPGKTIFRVWNRAHIPADVGKRIFQRHFSTKSDMGRGYGTYSMKFFGEQVLGGTVTFSSSPEEGTVFTFSLDT